MNETIETENVGQVIYSQMGGQRFAIMTGARQLVELENGLQFRIPRAKNGINSVRIILAGDDTYTMIFSRIHGMSYAVIETVEGVYNDMLQDIFTDRTGLATRI